MKKSKLALYGGTPVRKKPFKPHPVLDKNERREVLSVLETGLFSGFIANAGPAFLGGPKVRKFEDMAKEHFGVPYAVAVNSATAGLHAALSALGIGPGDEVIVTPYTMSASAAAVLMQNAVPVFADIDPVTFCLDPRSVEKKITARTRAILVVHLFGQAAPMDEIMAIARRRKLVVVEDCAQAPDAEYKGRKVGTIGDIGVFSLNQHKTITTGEGGWAMTRDARLALRMQLVRNHGEVVVDHVKSDFDPGPVLGWNYRMTELEGAVAVAQFAKLWKLTAHRVDLVRRFLKAVAGLEGLMAPVTRAGSTHVYFLVPFRYDAAKTGVPRDLFVKALVAEGVPFGAGYVRPIYLDRAYRERKIYERSSMPFDKAPKYRRGDCPVAERMHFEELVTTNICRAPLSPADIDDVARAVRKVHAAVGELAARAAEVVPT